jgi:SNF2 family DNA or RNA helicase
MIFKTKPLAHQLHFLKEHSDKPYWAEFWEMGTGKTKFAIDWIRMKMYKHGRPMRVLIVCPKVVQYNWLEEFEKHSSLASRVHVVDGTRQQVERGLQKIPNESIIVINYDKLSYKIRKGAGGKAMDAVEGRPNIYVDRTKRWIIEMSYMHDYLRQNPPEIIILDESHKIKSSKAGRTQSLLQLGPMSMYRLALTGTPMPNGAEDIFNQILFLDGGLTFGTNEMTFRRQWMCDINASKRMCGGKYFPDWVLIKALEPAFRERVATVSTTLKKEDCLDLPEKVFMHQYCEMSEDQAKMYKQLKQDFIAYLEGDTVVADQAASKILRLNQVSSGFYKTDTGEEKRFKTNPKLNALTELLEDLCSTTKVIVWAVYRNNIFQLIEALKPYNPAIIFGDTKDKQAEATKFRTDPTCRVIIANPASAGIGINLVEASYAIWFSKNYNLEDWLQANDRCHRVGSERHAKITYIELMFQSSIDTIISKALQEKLDIQNRLTDTRFWVDS